MESAKNLKDWVDICIPYIRQGMSYNAFSLYAWAFSRYGHTPFDVRGKGDIGEIIFPNMHYPSRRAALSLAIKCLCRLGFAVLDGDMLSITDKEPVVGVVQVHITRKPKSSGYKKPLQVCVRVPRVIEVKRRIEREKVVDKTSYEYRTRNKHKMRGAKNGR